MQGIRKPYKYEISVKVVDGPGGAGKVKSFYDDDFTNLNVKVAFQSDKYCSTEYLMNLSEALHAIDRHEVVKYTNRTVEEEVKRRLDEKLHT